VVKLFVEVEKAFTAKLKAISLKQKAWDCHIFLFFDQKKRDAVLIDLRKIAKSHTTSFVLCAFCKLKAITLKQKAWTATISFLRSKKRDAVLIDLRELRSRTQQALCFVPSAS
jgi:hypothetical protein